MDAASASDPRVREPGSGQSMGELGGIPASPDPPSTVGSLPNGRHRGRCQAREFGPPMAIQRHTGRQPSPDDAGGGAVLVCSSGRDNRRSGGSRDCQAAPFAGIRWRRRTLPDAGRGQGLLTGILPTALDCRTVPVLRTARRSPGPPTGSHPCQTRMPIATARYATSSSRRDRSRSSACWIMTSPRNDAG